MIISERKNDLSRAAEELAALVRAAIIDTLIEEDEVITISKKEAFGHALDVAAILHGYEESPESLKSMPTEECTRFVHTIIEGIFELHKAEEEDGE